MRRFLVPILLAALVLPATPAGAIPGGHYAIGDSVMLGAKPQLGARGIQVNARVSRQFEEAVTIVRRRAASGLLRRRLIVHLGTNGILIQASQCDAIARAAGRHRRVYLVTVTGPRRYPGIRKTQNMRMRACARRHRNTRLLDWSAFSHGHRAWFYDGMHLTPSGRIAYAAFLASRTS